VWAMQGDRRVPSYSRSPQRGSCSYEYIASRIAYPRATRLPLSIM
jgi:hypothetical protein